MRGKFMNDLKEQMECQFDNINFIIKGTPGYRIAKAPTMDMQAKLICDTWNDGLGLYSVAMDGDGILVRAASKEEAKNKAIDYYIFHTGYEPNDITLHKVKITDYTPEQIKRLFILE